MAKGKTPVKIMETVLRDAHQSLIATRMTTEQMLPIIDKMDQVGYHAVECWGGATFDASLRFLKEDPWERLRKIKAGFKNTKLQMLFRGQNILGYRHYADDVVEYFVQKSIANGIRDADSKNRRLIDNKQLTHQLYRISGEGELAVQYLLQFQTEFCTDLLNNTESTLLDEVRRWEQRISQRISFNIEDDKLGHVVITYGYSSSNDQRKSIEGISADNMGFGISYSLAIIIALLSAQPGALIILENPEAHLHPQAQWEIANLISLVSERGVQVVVETHSDHIINGVLVNCKKKERGGNGINKEKVSIYYIGGKDEFHSAIVEKISVLEDGKLDKQPYGFFDRAETDLMYLAGWRE